MAKSVSIPLNHLDRLTDSTGLIQHAIYSIPRRESGYTTDDNARALRLTVRLWERDPNNTMLERVTCYLSFLEHARHPVKGFHNFMSFQRDWLDAGGCGDCQGQAVLALAEVVGSHLPDGIRLVARELLENSLAAIADLRSLRAQAYLIQAWALLCRANVSRIERLEIIAKSAADRLADCYHRSQRPDWFWFESRMTYANAVLPHALFDASECWPDDDFLSIAETSFGFLNLATSADGFFWPVGNQNWYPRGEEKSAFDQQPVEASTMMAAALAGFERTSNQEHLHAALRAQRWFAGQNSIEKSLIDVHAGACCDGLHSSGLNLNQGAESTLSYLWTELLWVTSQPSFSHENRLAMSLDDCRTIGIVEADSLTWKNG